MDWVPAHFPKDDWALARFDGTPLYEHADPARGEHPEWGTYIFDFGRREVRNFLVANALYWLEVFHIDGLRVDAVASMLYLDYSRKEGEWTPNVHGGRENLEAVSFLQEMNATCYKRPPGVVTIAEESTAWPGVTRPTHVGGLGFGFKWNMGWMHDSLGYMAHDPIHRQYHHHQMTFSMMYAYAENYVLPLSHDEVVHGKGSLLRKMPGDRWRQLANLRAYLAYMWAHPGKQLIFMGIELAQEAEWAESRELDWWLLDHVEHRGVHDLVGDLNRIYRDTPALWTQDQDPAGFSWIDANDNANNVFSFLRVGSDGSHVACVSNFSATPRHDYRLGLPIEGTWTEILNTDADTYYGSGVGNLGAVTADPRSGTAVRRRPPSSFRRSAPSGSPSPPETSRSGAGGGDEGAVLAEGEGVAGGRELEQHLVVVGQTGSVPDRPGEEATGLGALEPQRVTTADVVPLGSHQVDEDQGAPAVELQRVLTVAARQVCSKPTSVGWAATYSRIWVMNESTSKSSAYDDAGSASTSA